MTATPTSRGKGTYFDTATTRRTGRARCSTGPLVVVSRSARAIAGGRFWLVVAMVFMFAAVGRAHMVVVDAGSSQVFTVSGTATNSAWKLDGVAVGTNGPSFTYAPAIQDVGTHYLAVDQMWASGAKSNTSWQVRVRITLPASAVNYYVATSGVDTNPGTIGAPFKTLEKAQMAVRALSRPLAAGGVTVWLRGGTHWRTSTFALTGSDSGTPAAPIVYRGYTGETAVVSAGKAIPASSFVPLSVTERSRVAPGVIATNILEMDITSAGLVNHGPFPNKFNQWVSRNVYSTSNDGGLLELFYNGQRMYLSRYPNHNPTNDSLTTSMQMDGVAVDVTGTNYLNGSGTYAYSGGRTVAVGGAFHYKAAVCQGWRLVAGLLACGLAG
jgi:hypothetical protein